MVRGDAHAGRWAQSSPRRAVYCPLFAAFGPDPIRQRLELGRARVLVTTASLYQRKLAGWIDDVHFTSGTTGTPKGAVHVHGAVIAQHATAEWALDLRPDDVFWCTADPGWVTGTAYGVVAPLTIGATCLVDEGEFDAGR